MNRQSFPRRRYRNSIVGSGTTAVAAVLALLVILLAAFRFAVPSAWNAVTAPVWRMGASLSSHVRGTGTVESKTVLLAERDSYASQVTRLTAENAALSAKVADLTKLLGSRTEPVQGIVAAVMARPPVAPYDVLILDQGSSAGVTLGASVTADGGTPVGTIGQVDGAQSRVTLYSTRDIKTSGWIGAARIPVTLTGAGAGAFTASVPKVAGVNPGDGVYLANAGAYPIGTVVSIDSDPSSPTVNLEVRPYVNPFSLTWVTVAK